MRKWLKLYGWVYIILMVLMAKTWDWPSMVQARHQYLLGLFYNEYFQNKNDAIVYFSYYLRQKPNDKRVRSLLDEIR